MKDILEGSKMLLGESLLMIGDSLKDVVIVGGWGPYLRHSDKHPGTKDVDVLFPITYTKDSIGEILNRFLNYGFYISAKNDFQLCRAYKLNQQTYVYNVDLLHPTEGKVNKVDFIEIMDLDVTVDGIRVKPIMTREIQHGDVIYLEKLFETTEFNGMSFNVLDASGIIISKLDSCHNKKRERDIYDIYLSLLEPNALEKVNQLTKLNPHLEREVQKYLEKITSDWKTYEKHLEQFGVKDTKAKQILMMGRSIIK